MFSNIIITNYKNFILCIKFIDGIVDDLGLYPTDAEHINSVYIGKVKNIVKNIQAAFLDVAPGMTCYLSLGECKNLLITNRVREAYDLRIGDEVLVQIIKGSVKSKKPICTGNLRLPKEIKEELIKKAPMRSCYSVLYSGKPAYFDFFKRNNINEIDKITCENLNIYDEIRGNISTKHAEKIHLYDDEFPLNKLYKINTVIDEITNKTIWLKSGANIVIEYTEAMTVIDVNTAKSIRDKDDNHILNTNLEALEEIIRQLRLRNISGMILIDFINDSADNTEILIEKIKEKVRIEKIKTEFIDITGLGIVELTRSKKYPPIYKILNTKNSSDNNE